MSNWWNILRNASYFARFGPPPPLDHLWSLAVEEQFYLLWPFLLWLGLRYVHRRYRLVGLTLAAAGPQERGKEAVFGCILPPGRKIEPPFGDLSDSLYTEF